MAQRLLYRNAAGRGTSNQAVVSLDIVLCTGGEFVMYHFVLYCCDWVMQ